MKKIEIEILDNDNDNCIASIEVKSNNDVTKKEIDLSNYLVTLLNDKLKDLSNFDKKLIDNVKLQNVSLNNTNKNVEKTLIISGKNRKG